MQQLTQAGGLDAEWSPRRSNGTSAIAYPSGGHIWVLAMDASLNPVGSPRQVTMARANETFPSWSPSGMQIAFQSDRGRGLHIFVMTDVGNNGSEAGSNITQVTNSNKADERPAWE